MNSAAGSSDREMSKIEDSISYKLNALKEIWVGFLQVAANRDSIKIIIDGLTKISELLVKVLEMPGANVAVIGGAAIGLGALVQKAKEAASPLLTLSSIFKELFGKESPLSNVQNVEKGVIQTVNKMKETAQSGASPTQKTIYSASGQALTVVDTEITNKNTEANLENAASNEAKAASEIKDSAVKKDNIATTEADSIATDKNTKANKNNITSLLSLAKAHKLATGGIIVAVAAITTIITLYQKEKQSVEDLASSMEELGKTYETNKKQTSDNISSVQSLYEEYQQLASGVDALGNNKGLSDENFDKYNDLTNQIAEKMPNLVQGWTDQGNAILVCKDNMELLNAEIAKQQKQVYQDVIDNGSDILKNYNNIVNGYQSAFYSTQGTKDKKRQLSDAQEQIAALKKLIAEQNSGGTDFNSYKYASKNSDLYKKGGYLIQPTKEMQEVAEVADEISNKWQAIISKLNSLGVDTSQFSISSESLQSWDDLSSVIIRVEKEIPGLSSDIKDEEDSVVSTVKAMADAYLHLYDDGEKTFDDLSNNMSASISTLIQSLDSDTIDALGFTTQDAVKDFVDNTVEVMLNNPAVGNAIVGLFTIDKSMSAKAAQNVAIPYINTLKKALADGDIPEAIYNMLVGQTDWIDETVEKQKNAIRGALGDHSDRTVEGYLQNQMDSLSTAEEQEDFTTYLNGLDHVINTIQEAQQAWKQYQQQIKTDIATTSSFDLTSFSSAIESLNKVNTAYQKVAENIKANKIGKEIVSDINDIEALREEFKDLSDTDLDFGSFGSGMEGFDKIERVLTNSSSSAAEMQDAFDQLGTTLVNAKMAANDYDETSQQLVSSQLQQAGATKESADAYVASATAMHQAKEQVAEASGSVENATAAEILALAQEGNVSAEVAAALLELAMEKVNANGITIMTSSDIDNLYALMVQAGATTDQLNALAAAKANASDAEGFSKTGAGGMPSSEIENQKKQASKSASKTASDFYQDYKDKHKIDFSYTPKSGSGGGGGGGGSESDAKDEYVEEFEKQYEKLGELRDNDKIDEYEYCQYLRALYEKFFKDKKKYAEQYEKYEHEYLSGMKSLYDKVFSGLSSQIDKQISKLNDQKSKATENLKSQKTAAVNALKAEKEAAVAAIEAQIDAIKEQQKQIQKQIDAYQDEIDAINEANEARQRELALQKALYDLDKLQNQRTNLVYSESQGMHYESDLSGIRDARQTVQEAKDDIEIANIQKKIDLLQKQKDLLDDQIDALEEQKQAIEDYYDDLIDETEAYYDQLIADMEEFYDKQIENLNKGKDAIEEIQDALELAELKHLLNDLGVDFDELMTKLQNGDDSALKDLTTQYESLLVTMNQGNQDLINQFAEIRNIDLGKLPDYLEATSSAFKGIENANFDVVKDGIAGIQQAFEDLGNDADTYALLGQHLSEDFVKGFKIATGDGSIDSAVNEYGTAFKKSFNSFFDDGSQTSEIGTNITAGIGKGMTSEEATAQIASDSKVVAQNTVDEMKIADEIHSPSELIEREVGKYVGEGVITGALKSIDDPEFQSYLQQFINGVAQKLHDAFAQMDTSNLLDLSSIFGVVEDTGKEGNSTANIFSQLLEDIQAFADAFANIDITNVVTQFTDLRDAVLDVSSAIGGTTGASESGDQAQGGTSGTGKPSKKSSSSHNSSSNQQSNSGGSLTEAMQSFGDTATEVLGGGGEDGDDEEGSGVIGQFATLKTKVEDVTTAIGTDEDSGSGGKSGGKGKGKGKGEDSGTLIEALQAEQEVAFDEEKGLPAQNEQWATLQSNIQKCVDAVQRLIDKLTELEEFSLTVHFSGHSSGGGSGHASADGTVASHASGSFPVTMHSYAKGSNVGLEHDQRALIGEVGYEGLVRQNRFSLVGKNGAEMMSLKKGDIIFSHSQTKELLKNGKIHSRGKAVGTHSYADGTPLKSALKFAGSDYSSTQLAALATKLTGVMDGISVGIDSIERRTTELANKVPNVTTNTANKTSNVTIGDIHVSGVQDVDSFAKAVKSYLPGRMLQELHKN